MNREQYVTMIIQYKIDIQATNKKTHKFLISRLGKNGFLVEHISETGKSRDHTTPTMVIFFLSIIIYLQQTTLEAISRDREHGLP
jgi:hypothetical protein